MPLDYKYRIPDYRRSRRRRARLWLLAAVFLAAVAAVGAILLWSRDASETQPVATAAPAGAEGMGAGKPSPAGAAPRGAGGVDGDSGKRADAKAGSPAEASSALPKPVEPRFTFYKILPEKEVILPESEIRTIKREEKQGKIVPGVGYTVQVGSFRTREEAERLLAGLGKIKIKAKLEGVKIDEVTWFRVKIGTYQNLSEADRMRAFLRKHGFDSVVQKSSPPLPQSKVPKP
jgi:cell division septation protein DedD